MIANQNIGLTIGKNPNSFIVVSSYLDDVILPSNQISYQEILLRFICDVPHRPRTFVISVQSIPDDISQNLPVPVVFNGRLPLDDDFRGRPR